MRGSCDCCNAQDVRLTFHIVTGIETYACAKCRGIDEDEGMSGLPICTITGRIAGDGFACGDCDPCIMGAASVPAAVKALLKERDEWMSKYAEAMAEADEYVMAPSTTETQHQ